MHALLTVFTLLLSLMAGGFVDGEDPTDLDSGWQATEASQSVEEEDKGPSADPWG